MKWRCVLPLLLAAGFAVSAECKVHVGAIAGVPVSKLLIELARIKNKSINLQIPKNLRSAFVIASGTLEEVLQVLCGDIECVISKEGIYVSDSLAHRCYTVQLMTEDAEAWTELEKGIACMMSKKAQYRVNKRTSSISVMGTEQDHRQIAKYIEELNQRLNARIRVHVVIITVTSEHSIAGINGQEILDGLMQGAVPDASKILSAICNAFGEYGNVKTSSDIFLDIAHGRKAHFEIAEEDVYFEVINTPKHKNYIAKPQIRKVAGTKLIIQPVARPGGATLKVDFEVLQPHGKANPSVIAMKASNAYEAALIEQSKIPVTHRKSINTMVNLDKGKAALIGGLSSVITSREYKGIPFIGRDRYKRAHKATYMYISLGDYSSKVVSTKNKDDCTRAIHKARSGKSKLRSMRSTKRASSQPVK